MTTRSLGGYTGYSIICIKVELLPVLNHYSTLSSKLPSQHHFSISSHSTHPSPKMSPKTNLDIVFGAMTFGKEGTSPLHLPHNL